jgi:hypothetical protein
MEGRRGNPLINRRLLRVLGTLAMTVRVSQLPERTPSIDEVAVEGDVLRLGKIEAWRQAS